MRKGILFVLLLLLLAAFFLLKKYSTPDLVAPPPAPPYEVVPATHPIETPVLPVVISTPMDPIEKIKKEVKPAKVVKPQPQPKTKGPAALPVTPISRPPKIEIHEELIPKDINIVRVYYAADITGPDSLVEFDINGSGFTREFERMIKVKSGHPNVAVQGLTLKTPNQIHGVLIVGSTAPTSLAFPQVLIEGKVVFQAGQPYAVIRPGEVLDLGITEMGESGRSGRFRVFTNLSQEMFQNFSIIVSTPSIQILEIAPRLPYIIDATILIGPTPTGFYDLTLFVRDKKIWERKGLIQVVSPAAGEAGLVQQITAKDGFYRPGDRAEFAVQGSGFHPQDTTLLNAEVEGLTQAIPSLFTYVAPGRMDLFVTIPSTMPVGSYSIAIRQKEKTMKAPFTVVPTNWTRQLYLDPPLHPGGQSALILEGRDMDLNFVKDIKVDWDETGLTLTPFKWESATKAVSEIKASSTVGAGDYWLKMKTSQGPVVPQLGSIIRVGEKK